MGDKTTILCDKITKNRLFKLKKSCEVTYDKLLNYLIDKEVEEMDSAR